MQMEMQLTEKPLFTAEKIFVGVLDIRMKPRKFETI